MTIMGTEDKARRSYEDFAEAMSYVETQQDEAVDLRDGREVMCGTCGPQKSANDSCPKCGGFAQPLLGGQVLEEMIRSRAELLAENIAADDRLKLRQAEKKYRDLLALLESAVIADPLRPKEMTTLWTIIEMEEYATRCGECRELTCHGCES